MISSLMNPRFPVIIAYIACFTIITILIYSEAISQEYGTCIAMIARKGTVMIGADSRVMGPGRKISGEDTFCKIIQLDRRVFFAMSGMYSFRKIFNAKEIARYSWNPKRTTRENIREFERICQLRIKRSIEAGLARNGVRPQCIFVDMGAVNPTMYRRRFNLTVSPTDTDITRGDLSLNKAFTDIFGACADPIDSKKDMHYRFLRGPTWKDAILGFIENAKERLPSVGGDIDILYLTKSDAVWIQKKKNCPDIWK